MSSRTSRSIAAVAGAALLLVCAHPASARAPIADGDADGVPDERDTCLYTPRGVVVGPNGCSTPGDEDEDGVADVADACPQSPPGARVDAQGCAIDGDLDGVADGLDRCANSPAGVRVDVRGCAPGQVAAAPATMRTSPVAVAVAAAPAAKVAVPPALPSPVTAAAAAPAGQNPASSAQAEPDRTFHFDPGDSDLGWSSARAVKQSARELLKELEQDPALALVVSGHGDIKFDGMQVARLATARATAVRDTLVVAGIPAQRLTLRLPGISEPRFYGQDQRRNCRVEVRVTGRPSRPAPAPAPVVSAVAPAAPPAAAPITTAAPHRFPDPPPRVRPEPPPKPAATPPPPAVRPAPPAATQAAVALPRALAPTSVSFEPFSAVLDAPAIQALNAFVQTATRVMLADTASRVVIVSGIGTGEAGPYAPRLAESRAGSVGAYLAAMGVPHTRVEVSRQAQTGERRVDVSVMAR